VVVASNRHILRSLFSRIVMLRTDDPANHDALLRLAAFEYVKRAAAGYALREIKQRLHQASFREAVLSAYENRCAIGGDRDRAAVAAGLVKNSRYATWHLISRSAVLRGVVPRELGRVRRTGLSGRALPIQNCACPRRVQWRTRTRRTRSLSRAG
jgi:hypothetical protein